MFDRRNSNSDRDASLAEQRRFVPPRCPYLDCPSKTDGNFSYAKGGTFRRKQAPRQVQRFRCRVCHRHFSTQTFEGSYRQHRPEIDRGVRNSGLACSSNRQIAEILRCSKSTVAHKIARLARQGLRFQNRLLATAPKFTGRLVWDGLWSYETSRCFPYWLNIAVHAESDFVFGLSDSPLRRSGTMTAAQILERVRAEATFGRPDPKAIRNGTAELLEAVLPFFDLANTTLVSDEHKAYPRAIRDAGAAGIAHITVSSKQNRTARNPLFSINLADLLIRHTSSNQKRETIAFSKRRQAGIEKGILWMIRRNFMAPRRVKTNSPPPAVHLGLVARTQTFEDIFGKRIFDDEVELPKVWKRQIERRVFTPAVPNNRIHALSYAY